MSCRSAIDQGGRTQVALPERLTQEALRRVHDAAPYAVNDLEPLTTEIAAAIRAALDAAATVVRAIEPAVPADAPVAPWQSGRLAVIARAVEAIGRLKT